MLARVVENTRACNLDKGDLLREVIVKIGLERIDMQEEVIVEALLNSRVTGLAISLDFTKNRDLS